MNQKPKNKQKTQNYLDLQAHLIEKRGIECHLNTELTPEKAKEYGADVILIAAGATPLKLPLPGIDGSNVMSAEHAYLNADEVGEKAIVLGGGLSGIELAIYLSELGKKVTIIEMANALNFGGNVLHSMAARHQLEILDVKIVTSTKAAEINDKGVIGEYVGDAFSPAGPCETIVKGGLNSVINSQPPVSGKKEGEKQLDGVGVSMSTPQAEVFAYLPHTLQVEGCHLVVLPGFCQIVQLFCQFLQVFVGNIPVQR